MTKFLQDEVRVITGCIMTEEWKFIFLTSREVALGMCGSDEFSGVMIVVAHLLFRLERRLFKLPFANMTTICIIKFFRFLW
jgi:hypothetical protein